MDGTPPLRTVIRAMERLLRSPRANFDSATATQIRACLVWAMDLDRFGATPTDLGELRDGMLSVCRNLRSDWPFDSDFESSDQYLVIQQLLAAAELLPPLRQCSEVIG